MTTLLINNGAHPDIMQVGSKFLSLYWTVIISKNKEMTKLLAEKGANLNFCKQDYHPSHLVFEAVIADDQDDVKFFVQYGSFVDIKINNASNLLEYALMNGHKEMAAIILQNMSDKNISEPSKGPLLDAILTKMIKSTPKPHKIKSKIARLSDLLEIFTVDNPNLNGKAVLFGISTLPLLEKLYNLYLCPNTWVNENIPRF
jgi:ankyrin repeat protein